MSGNGDFALKPQVRAGAALRLMPGWTLAADVDVTENDSEALDGFKSRLLSVGTEYQIGAGEAFLALRAGAFTNLAANQSDSFTLTAGVGFRLWHLEIDLAVAAAPSLEEIEAGDFEIPRRFDVSGAIKYVRKF